MFNGEEFPHNTHTQPKMISRQCCSYAYHKWPNSSPAVFSLNSSMCLPVADCLPIKAAIPLRPQHALLRHRIWTLTMASYLCCSHMVPTCKTSYIHPFFCLSGFLPSFCLLQPAAVFFLSSFIPSLYRPIVVSLTGTVDHDLTTWSEWITATWL